MSYPHIGRWSNSVDIDGSSTPKDNTVYFFPEPWWGNDGTQELHSVVINFNPGRGGNEQYTKITPNIAAFSSYRSFVKNNVIAYTFKNFTKCGVTGNYMSGMVNPFLYNTCNWHYKKRAERIFNAINKIVKPNAPYNLQNHLSIELIPWHTSYVDTVFHNYVAENRYAIFENCIKFAANECARISNPILKNVVIVRMSSSAFKQCLGGIGGFNYLKKEIPIKSGNYCIYEFTQIPNIKFVCIWGSRSRNNFPSDETLNEVLKEIVLYKLNH